MQRVCTVLFILPVFLLSPYLTQAADHSLQKELQGLLERSRVLIEKACQKAIEAGPVTSELTELKNLSLEIQAVHLLLEDQFRQREEEIMTRGAKALERHRAVSEGYSRALREYLSLMESFPSGSRISLSRLDLLKSLLDGILPRRKRPILGTLPYKHLNSPQREPNSDPPITPAYRGGKKTVTDDDLKSTQEAPITKAMGDLAQSLLWNPVSIYEWVKNNIETEWYWGSMKGAEETLRQKSGNDCDQASLLIALLRASGYPARYVRGVIEIFPDIERVKNLTGVSDPTNIALFFQKAGIPFKPIIAGGRISSFQIEHIWVETQVPYANYRGAILDEHGKTWLGLDTSIKVTGYIYNSPIDVVREISLSNLRDQYLNWVQTQTPLEYTRGYINSQLATRNPPLVTGDSEPATYGHFLRTRALIPETMKILPASMQYPQIKASHEYTEIPDELKHRVAFTATRNPRLPEGTPENELFSVTLPVSEVSNRKIVIACEPETIEDQGIINGYGGLDNTPSYLVRLRPLIALNDRAVTVGKVGLPMGEEYGLTVELQRPGYGREKVSNTHIVGNLSVVGIVAQKTVPGSGVQVSGDEEKDAEQILYEEAIHYVDRWNRAEDELSSLLHLSIARPLPTVVAIGGVIDVTTLLDTPHGFDWKGVYVDAGLRAIETVASSGYRAPGEGEREKIFMQLSALQGSILENRLFEDDFRVESISTAKLLSLARNTGPVTEILTIEKSNIDGILPALPFDENVKEDITNAVNQNFSVLIPQSLMTYEDWTGIGYIKENPATGEAGYMLSGTIAGGMTAWGIDRWPDYYRDRLENPDSEPANDDPGSAYSIQKITRTDLQKGRVGEPLLESLQVVVLDHNKKPVKNAEVTFSIKAGGGRFRENGSTTIKVSTDRVGIASSKLILGQKTGDNPTFSWEAGVAYPQQVGENIVEASLASGTRIMKPFTAYGFPKDPARIKKLHGDGTWGRILSFAGFVSVAIEDEYGNPRSNIPVMFEAQDASGNPDTPICSNPNRDPRQAYLVQAGESCIKTSPTWGDCGNPELQRRMVVTTSSKGAAAQIILGGLPNGHYPIKATHTDPISNAELATTFLHYTRPFGNCDGTEDPSLELAIEYVHPADRFGNNINAAKAGTSIPVMAKVRFLRENETQRELELFCDGNPVVCDKVVGTREYETSTDFSHVSVTFGGVEASTAGEGIFLGAYRLAPGINTIEMNAEAAIIGRRTEVCPSCATSEEEISRTSATTLQVYGVDLQIAAIPVILIESNGYASKDHTISYTISPSSYRASTAFVVISKDGEPISSIPTETWAGGFATISRGFVFDVNSTYEAEVVLNYGTGVEIRSRKQKLPIGGIRVVDENGEEADEVKFGDGSRKEKTYRIELASKVLTESCESLSGKIRVVNREGQRVEVPGDYPDDFYLTEHNLRFSLSDQRCAVQMEDGSAAGFPKDKFVVSNLNKYALTARWQNTADSGTMAVLYGGLGNKLEIEINQAKVDVAIEPVGVILIGIDGLRQDVLYPPEKEDVKDPHGNYYVDILGLPGIGQILEGVTLPEPYQRYIMLPKVTAIFPSITLASWASIFTGKLPHETGITGNEFFARDLYRLSDSEWNEFPGMANHGLPKGMITFSDGAFPNNTMDYFLKNLVPAHDYSRTTNQKIRNSSPNQSLDPNAETIYEWITNESSIKEKMLLRYGNTWACMNGGDCRTAAFFSHYGRGVDWWGTQDLKRYEEWAVHFLGESVKILGKLKPEMASEKLDEVPTKEALNFLEKYSSDKNRKFPALFVIYYAGPDHYAHEFGLNGGIAGYSGYSDYFKKYTDQRISEVVNKLKELGEFDNKIFIIVADHGMTAMPTNLTFRINEKFLDAGGNAYEITRELPAETSCTLKLDFRDPEEPDQLNIAREAEMNNNNLHIWELAEIFRALQEAKRDFSYRVLAPDQISELFVDVFAGARKNLNPGLGLPVSANVIAALNGPMVHVYLRSLAGWETLPPEEELKRFAQVLRVLLQIEGDEEAENHLGLDLVDYWNLVENNVGKLKKSVDRILIRLNGEYVEFNGYNVPNSFNLDAGYIKAIDRVRGLNNFKRSGDIVMIMKDKVADPVNERFSTGTACKSWHGSLNASDSYVPLIIAYPGGNKLEAGMIISEVTGCDLQQCEGNWKVTDLVKTIAEKHYSSQ